MSNQTNETQDKKNRVFLPLMIIALIFLAVIILINLKPLRSFLGAVIGILSPIILGAAIAYILNPVLKIFEFKIFKSIQNKRLVRVLSLILTYVFAILLLALVIAILLPRVTNSIIEIGSNYDLYIAKATEMINKAISSFTMESEFFDAEQIKKIVGEVITESSDIFYDIYTRVISYAMTLFTTLKNFFLALFISVYMLISKERLYAQATKTASAFLSSDAYTTMMRYARIANNTLGKFFVGKIFDSFLVSLLTLLLLLIFRMPYALLISAIIGILNIIPYLGIFIGTLFSAFLMLIASPSKVLAFILIMIIVQQIDSNIIAPKILGKSAGISSLAVIISVIVMGGYFGIPGMILAVPFSAIIISVIKTLLDKTLKRKGLVADTANYYEDPAYSIESKPHRTFAKTIADTIKNKVFKKKNSDHSDDEQSKS